MELGMITWIHEEDFRGAKEKGLQFVELDVNSRDQEFLENVDNIAAYSAKYEMPVRAVGRWGSTRISQAGIVEEELELYDLADELRGILDQNGPVEQFLLAVLSHASIYSSSEITSSRITKSTPLC